MNKGYERYLVGNRFKTFLRSKVVLDSIIRWLAYDRGYRSSTFATYDEHTHLGYDLAYRAGARRAQRNGEQDGQTN